MICSLVSCLDVGQLMLSSLSQNLKKDFWTKMKNFALIDLEKAFDRVSHEVL